MLLIAGELNRVGILMWAATYGIFGVRGIKASTATAAAIRPAGHLPQLARFFECARPEFNLAFTHW